MANKDLKDYNRTEQTLKPSAEGRLRSKDNYGELNIETAKYIIKIKNRDLLNTIRDSCDKLLK